MRFISESFGAQVDWNEEELKATATLDGKTIEFTIGSNQMVVDGVAQTIDTIAEQTNDRTMLPLRALVEALGKNVLWDERGLIIITNPDCLLYTSFFDMIDCAFGDHVSTFCARLRSHLNNPVCFLSLIHI